MAMPKNLVLVRHGQSEGNYAYHMLKNGINLFTEEFRRRPGFTWRLTSLGVEQAKTAGDWIRNNIAKKFFRYYTSDYVRARETLLHLNFEGAESMVNPYIYEQSWGLYEGMPEHEWAQYYPEDEHLRQVSSFYWQPPRGQSLIEVALRVDRAFDTLHRECSEEDVLMVCHGGIIRVIEILVEKINVDGYSRLSKSEHPHDKIRNCQIVHFSRINPETKEIEPHLNWKRKTCPWDLSLSSNEWQRISRPKFSSSDLLRQIENYPRLIDNLPPEKK